MNLHIIILAAGKGTRMRSKLPKVLHKLADKALVEHVHETAKKLNPASINIVYGHGGESVPQTLNNLDANWIEQTEQLGTGHAVEQALKEIKEEGTILILYGDVPLITESTLSALTNVYLSKQNAIGLLTARLNNPKGYGRIVRDEKGVVQRIVEQKDASDAEQRINEINTGILCADSTNLRKWIDNLENNNAQGEFYLTDIIEMAVSEGGVVATHTSHNIWEIEGVNNKLQLADLERQHQLNIANKLMESGVCLRDPYRIDVRGNLKTGMDVLIDVNCIFEGEVQLGDDVNVGANSLIINSIIANNVSIKPNSVIENSVIGSNCEIGPFARIRPDTKLADNVKVGNFVEIKKALIESNSKVNHLSYIGDTHMGKNVNVGAGTITCNYDGANKHLTSIGDDVFIGSDSQLVAPVSVGDGATIGAGSTITKDVPASELTLSRSKQNTINGWTRPSKKKK